jgi:hypothetical protein
LQQSFFFKGVLVFLFQGARRAQDQIDDDPGQKQHCHHQDCQDAGERIARPPADVAISPDDQAEP